MRTVFGVLGLLTLGAAMFIGTYAAFGALGEFGKAQDEPSLVGLEATGEATNQQARQAAAALDEPVTAGDVKWTITHASEETELHSYTFPPEHVPARYVTIEFTVENVTDRPVTLTGDTVALFDESGIEYRPEPDRNSVFVRPELNILFNEHSLLHPGASKEGKVNFEVLPEAWGFTALLRETDPTVSEGEYVDLEF